MFSDMKIAKFNNCVKVELSAKPTITKDL